MVRALSIAFHLALVFAASPAWSRYTIVVSQATFNDPQWKPVVEALVEKHDAKVVKFASHVDASIPALREQFPRYVCFVARPSEAGSDFVAKVHRLMRKLDDDIYTDALWGILTGYDAAAALRIAQHTEPLQVDRVAAGTEVALDKCAEGLWYCELKKSRMVRKSPGQRPKEQKGPDDTTEALVDTLNKYQAQLFVTSGHATERDWQIGYSYPNGTFQSKAGKLFGVDTHGEKFPVESSTPKVYLPIGNCLMGHIDGPDAMALAWMNTAGVTQMIGYAVPTWYGYGGWGLLDYFVEQPGRYTMAEAFYVNHQALLHRLESTRVKATELTENDARGLLYDRDVVAFYGDPAWIARMAPGECAFDQSLTEKDGEYRFQIQPNLGERSFEPVNTNGAQRGGRPIVHLLPRRIDVKTLKIIEGADLEPVITDNFILVPLPKKCDANRSYRVVFAADSATSS